MDANVGVDVRRQGQDQDQNVDHFDALYKKLNHLVWVIEIKGMARKDEKTTYLSGFMVNKDELHGYLMTCSHGGWLTWSNLELKVRKLDGISGFEFDAKVVAPKTKWDMCLLQVNVSGLEDNDCAKLGSGDVKFGEAVMAIGHSKEFVGSCVPGYASFECTHQVEANYDNFDTCLCYTSDALQKTPPYRIMGHLYDSRYFIQAEEQDRTENPKFKVDRSFEKSLQPRLPIIQCSGFNGGPGTSGAPMFNMREEVVGMILLGTEGYQIGSHVTALKTFLLQNKLLKEDTKSEVVIHESSESIAKRMKT